MTGCAATVRSATSSSKGDKRRIGTLLFSGVVVDRLIIRRAVKVGKPCSANSTGSVGDAGPSGERYSTA
jgi:hypothetical protein